jgi:hypothetical protein
MNGRESWIPYDKNPGYIFYFRPGHYNKNEDFEIQYRTS